ncbi:MAG TPA: aminotransferase class I/II-fold pyridoxal phosphate-dependent enzyme [Pseudonocardia sp.]|jgi:cystathionine beta-lyase
MSGLWEPRLDRLRARRSDKWTAFDSDVLPLPVAEADVRLAAPVARVLRDAVDNSDTGYAGDSTALRTAFAGFAARRWDWMLDPADTRACADVATGITEVLRLLVRPGEPVLLCPPVYPPFWAWLDAVAARPAEVPLRPGGQLDLPAIETALTGGNIRVLLLCHPQNPTGRVNRPDELHELATLAARHQVTVLSDEIHAPLTLPGTRFVSYLSVSPEAAATGIAFHSPSKAWNLAGLKCALIVATDPARRQVMERLPYDLRWGIGHFGLIAGEAAYEEGEPWLDELRDALADNAALVASLLAEHLPLVDFRVPEATYLAWLDCRGMGLGHDPAATFLTRGRVALSPGPGFGAPGLGYARLNLATHPDLLREAVTRMVAATG